MIQQKQIKNISRKIQAISEHFQFKARVPEKAILNKNLQQCLNKYPKCFWINSAKSYNQISQIIEYIQLCKVQYFIIIRAQIKSLNSLKNINFTNLKVLYLQQNKIQSIENINQIKMPNIREISLRNNLITNISSLKRIIFNQINNQNQQKQKQCITKLSLDGNRITDIGCLSLCNLMLQGLFLEIATYDHTCGIDLRPLMKILFKRSSVLFTNSFHRLKQSQFLQVFQKKVK